MSVIFIYIYIHFSHIRPKHLNSEIPKCKAPHDKPHAQLQLQETAVLLGSLKLHDFLVLLDDCSITGCWAKLCCRALRVMVFVSAYAVCLVVS